MKAAIVLSTSCLMFLAGSVCALGGPVAIDRFYLLDAQNYTLLSGETSSPAQTTVIGSVPFTFWSDLANGVNPDELLAVDVNARAIARLSVSDASVLGQFTVSRDLRNLASNGPGGVVWGLPNTGPMELFTIALETGQATTVGLTGITESAFETVGLGYDPALDRLFATTANGRLYRINPADAATELLAETGFVGLFDVAYNYADGEMYATDSVSDSLYHIHRDTGAVTLVGGPYSASPRATGLAFAVPEPATLTLLTLSVLLLRRRS